MKSHNPTGSLFLLACLLVWTASAVCGAATEVVFTDPYSGNTAARDRMVQFINSATSTLDVAIYTFTYDQRGSTLSGVAGALQAARSRGVTLRIVTDADEVDSTSSTRFIILDVFDGSRNGSLNSATVRSGNYTGIMHNKFIVADSQRVLTGSNNWSTNADAANDENPVILASPGLVNRYFDNFRLLYVERSANAGGSQPIRRFGDPTGDNQITVADYEAARAIASNQRSATPFEIITGDVAPDPGVVGHVFGDGIVDGQDVAWLANYLGILQGTDRVGDILALPDGTGVETEPLVVTATFGTTFYVEQSDRAAGIRVQSAAVSVGDERVRWQA